MLLKAPRSYKGGILRPLGHREEIEKVDRATIPRSREIKNEACSVGGKNHFTDGIISKHVLKLNAGPYGSKYHKYRGTTWRLQAPVFTRLMIVNGCIKTLLIVHRQFQKVYNESAV